MWCLDGGQERFSRKSWNGAGGKPVQGRSILTAWLPPLQHPLSIWLWGMLILWFFSYSGGCFDCSFDGFLLLPVP